MFEKYTPQALRDGIERELQKCNDAKQAAYLAMAHLKEDPTYYDMQKAGSFEYQCPKCKSDKVQNGIDRSTGSMFQTCLVCRYKKPGKNSFDLIRMDNMDEMNKARITKYIRRVPKPSGKGFYYFYTKAQFDHFNKTGDPGKQEGHGGFIESIKNFFGVKTDDEVSKRVKDEYVKHGIEQNYHIPITSFTEHLVEYFSNKEKWQKLFALRTAKTEQKKDEKKKEKIADKKDSKGQRFNLGVMKFINSVYGEKKAEESPQIKKITEKHDKKIAEIQTKIDDIKKEIEAVKEETKAEIAKIDEQAKLDQK